MDIRSSGRPACQIGFQHGYLLAPEIEDLLKVTAAEQAHSNRKDWPFFRDAARTMMWPHIEQEYREELQGIVEGANAKGVKLDIWDVVALNAAEEWDYYVKEYDREHGIKPPRRWWRPNIAALLWRPAVTPRMAGSSSPTTIGQTIWMASAGR